MTTPDIIIIGSGMGGATLAAALAPWLDGPAPAPASVEGVALACALGYCARRHTVFTWRDGRAALAAWYDAATARPAFHETQPPLSGI